MTKTWTPITDRWQHTEFFEWAAATLHAEKEADYKRLPPFIKAKYSNLFRVAPHGIAISYHKTRGTEIFYPMAAWGRHWRSIELHREALFREMDPPPHPELADRLAHWRERLGVMSWLDLRQRAAIAVILAYQPNATHPTARA